MNVSKAKSSTAEVQRLDYHVFGFKLPLDFS